MASIASWIYDKSLRGNYTFTHDEVAQAFLDMNAGSIAWALTREVSKGRIMLPLRGFYVIVPDEYVLRRAVPQPFYLDDMTHHLGRKYYVALLSAASYYGASHQVQLRFSVTIDPPAIRDKKGEKYHLKSQPRYSEDIDLVQVKAEPINETIDYLRDALAWLGEPVVKQKKYNNTLVFKVQPTDMDAEEIHLKVEINCKEHFSVFPMVRVPFAVNSSWFKGPCEVLTYELAELTRTKLKVVYQRRKGRDLFDLWKILSMHPELDKGKVIENYERYLGFTALHLSAYKEFVLNMDGKLQDKEFLTDTGMILGSQEYALQVVWEKVKVELVERLNTEV